MTNMLMEMILMTHTMHTDEIPYTNLAEHCVDNGDDDGDIVMTKILMKMLLMTHAMHTDETPSIYQPG